MANESISATLVFGISSIETDLASSTEFYDDGKQNILKTIDNYLELLEKAKDTLILLRDSIGDDEIDKIKLISSIDGECLEIEGDEQIIDRFVAFGIAERNDDESIYSEKKTESDKSTLDDNSSSDDNSSLDTESEDSDKNSDSGSDKNSDSDSDKNSDKNSDSDSDSDQSTDSSSKSSDQSSDSE